MKIMINDTQYDVDGNISLAKVQATYYPESDLAIVNTVLCTDPDLKLHEGDRLHFIKRGELPQAQVLFELQFARQPDALTQSLQNACIGIAGAGGLGSVVAEILARAGVGRLVIADYDVVEPSNLNRQRFSLSQLGMPKVDALADNIALFNPFIEITRVSEKITGNNCDDVFSSCMAVAECFDSAENKAELVAGLRLRLPDCSIVAVSGIAGLDDAQNIKIRKVSKRFYVVGDQHSDAQAGTGLLASRVGVAAALQAHHIIRLITGEER
ncbi:MAG: sulfur carrier protein ThiS adenylyltransferase ThiF [Deltaproteobacteria bacterium]|nr:sulfur carrier protein ThiS adenylyltransferase ThiF [Deltaproteobacteria bacterium]